MAVDLLDDALQTPQPADADDLLEAHYDSLIAAGTHTAEDIAWLRARRRHQEEAEVCRFMIKTRNWEADPSCSEEVVHLCYAAALSGLQRRSEAVAFLEAACARQRQASWELMLAKLLFHENRKQESFARCRCVWHEAHLKEWRIAPAAQGPGLRRTP